jgi:uncharacterized protein
VKVLSGFPGIVVVILLFLAFFPHISVAGAKESTMKYFQGNDAEKMLEQALEQDSAEGVVKAIKAGANPNTRGLYGVTPLEMAVGKFKKQVVAELLRQGADTSVRDVEGDNAVTIAVRAYKRDPQLLDMLLNAGADPNTLLNDDDPIIVQFLADHDLNAIRYLHGKGANIDARERTGDPLIMSEGVTKDWDSVWTLLKLGAKFNYPNERYTWPKIFSNPTVTPPDSTLWPFKVKSWKFLKQHGQPVPAKLEDLIDQAYWDYLKTNNLPRPTLEELEKLGADRKSRF